MYVSDLAVDLRVQAESCKVIHLLWVDVWDCFVSVMMHGQYEEESFALEDV